MYTVGLFSLWRPGQPTGQGQTSCAAAADNRTSQTDLSSLRPYPNQLHGFEFMHNAAPGRVRSKSSRLIAKHKMLHKVKGWQVLQGMSSGSQQLHPHQEVKMEYLSVRCLD